MVRVPPTAGWISQSIRVAIMRASLDVFILATLRRTANVPPMSRQRKGRASKPTGWQTLDGRISTQFAALRPGGKTQILRPSGGQQRFWLNPQETGTGGETL